MSKYEAFLSNGIRPVPPSPEPEKLRQESEQLRQEIELLREQVEQAR